MKDKTKSRNAVWIVYLKEMKSIFRDKRMMGALVAPIFIMPVIILIVGLLAWSFFSRPVTIGVNNMDNPIVTELQAQRPNSVFIETTDFQQAITDGTISLGLNIPDDYETKVENLEPVQIEVIREPSNQASTDIAGDVSSVVADVNKSILDQQLAVNGISPDVANLVQTQSIAVTDNGLTEDDGISGVMAGLISFLPMILIFASSGGIFPIATELGAAEKERNSFEILLSTKANRVEILTGKLLTIVSFGFIASFIFVGGYSLLAIPLLFIPGIASVIGSFVSMQMLLIIGVMLIVMSLFMSTMALVISMVAKSYKEAQAYMGYMSFLFMIPSYITMFSDIRNIPFWQLNIPFINMIVTMKQVMSGIYIWPNIIITIAWNLLYTVIALVLIRKMLTKEQFLFRS